MSTNKRYNPSVVEDTILIPTFSSSPTMTLDSKKVLKNAVLEDSELNTPNKSGPGSQKGEVESLWQSQNRNTYFKDIKEILHKKLPPRSLSM